MGNHRQYRLEFEEWMLLCEGFEFSEIETHEQYIQFQDLYKKICWY
jgi:hypothetical protein